MCRVALLAALAVVLLSANVSQAQYYTTYYYPTTAYYQPTTVYYASAPATTSVAYAPAPANPCFGNVQPAAATTTYYAPTMTYYAATPTVYYPTVPRYRSFYRWW